MCHLTLFTCTGHRNASKHVNCVKNISPECELFGVDEHDHEDEGHGGHQEHQDPDWETVESLLSTCACRDSCCKHLQSSSLHSLLSLLGRSKVSSLERKRRLLRLFYSFIEPVHTTTELIFRFSYTINGTSVCESAFINLLQLSTHAP